MSRTEKLAEILGTFTKDEETFAEFYEARGEKEKAREIRLEKVRGLIANKAWADAERYHEAHDLLSSAELHQMAREWCRGVMEEWPWDALKIARKYYLLDLAKEAAVRRSEDILSKGHDAGPALDIARKERADDADYCKRAACQVFKQYIRSLSFSSLPGLIKEFPSAFSEDEMELAKELAEMARKQFEAINVRAKLKAVAS